MGSYLWATTWCRSDRCRYYALNVDQPVNEVQVLVMWSEAITAGPGSRRPNPEAGRCPNRALLDGADWREPLGICRAGRIVSEPRLVWAVRQIIWFWKPASQRSWRSWSVREESWYPDTESEDLCRVPLCPIEGLHQNWYTNGDMTNRTESARVHYLRARPWERETELVLQTFAAEI